MFLRKTSLFCVLLCAGAIFFSGCGDSDDDILIDTVVVYWFLTPQNPKATDFGCTETQSALRFKNTMATDQTFTLHTDETCSSPLTSPIYSVATGATSDYACVSSGSYAFKDSDGGCSSGTYTVNANFVYTVTVKDGSSEMILD